MSTSIRTATPIALVLLAGTLTVVTSPSAESPFRTESETGVLVGRVLEGKANVPFANIVLPDLRIGVMSNRYGEFAIPALPVGTHRVRVMMVGLETVERSVTIHANVETAALFLFRNQGLDTAQMSPPCQTNRALASTGTRSRARYVESHCHPRREPMLALGHSTLPIPQIGIVVTPAQRRVHSRELPAVPSEPWAVDVGELRWSVGRTSQAWHFVEPLG